MIFPEKTNKVNSSTSKLMRNNTDFSNTDKMIMSLTRLDTNFLSQRDNRKDQIEALVSRTENNTPKIFMQEPAVIQQIVMSSTGKATKELGLFEKGKKSKMVASTNNLVRRPKTSYYSNKFRRNMASVDYKFKDLGEPTESEIPTFREVVSQ